MPYVYVEELAEGQEEADVYTAEDYAKMQALRDEAAGKVETLTKSVDDLTEERDSLASQLDKAKTKFADAFLSSPDKAKRVQEQDVRSEGAPATFESLFNERNTYNAN